MIPDYRVELVLLFGRGIFLRRPYNCLIGITALLYALAGVKGREIVKDVKDILIHLSQYTVSNIDSAQLSLRSAHGEILKKKCTLV